LALQHKFVALQMLDSPENFNDQLDDTSLGLLGAKYPDIVSQILENEAFIVQLTDVGLCLMAESDIDTAIRVCECCTQKRNIAFKPEQLKGIADQHLDGVDFDDAHLRNWTLDTLYKALLEEKEQQERITDHFPNLI
jgi:hypothetical protein